MGLCIASVAGSAWHDSNAFVGRSPWNRTQSTPPAREPAMNEVTAEVSRVHSTHVQCTRTVLASQGQTSVETFDAVPNGECHPINRDNTAAFRLVGNTLQATLKGPPRPT